MARLMADDGSGASSKHAANDRSLLGVRSLIGAGRKSDKACEGDEWKNVFHEHVVLNLPQDTAAEAWRKSDLMF